MEAKPGDIFNGHILGQDNVWHRFVGDERPQAANAQQVEPEQVERLDRASHIEPGPGRQQLEPTPVPGYWARYTGRWPLTARIVGFVLGGVMTVDLAAKDDWNVLPLGVFTNFLVATVTDGLLYGSLVTFLVALYPGAAEERLLPGAPADAARPVSASDSASRKPTAALVCPDCGKTVTPEAWGLHPRYCVGQASQNL